MDNYRSPVQFKNVRFDFRLSLKFDLRLNSEFNRTMHGRMFTEQLIHLCKKLFFFFVWRQRGEPTTLLIVTHITHIYSETFPFLVIVVMQSNQQPAFYHSKTGSQTCASWAWRSTSSKSGNRKQGWTVEARSGHKVVLNSLNRSNQSVWMSVWVIYGTVCMCFHQDWWTKACAIKSLRRLLN